ncbi:hypothetical protein Tco_1415923 [Tanacetum coccineum]
MTQKSHHVVLPDDQMNSVINCLTAKSTWDDMILYYEGPSDKGSSKKVLKGSAVQKQLNKLNATNVARKQKPKLRLTKDFEGKYNKVKAKLALLSSSASASKAATIKNKGLIAEAYEWDEEEVSSDEK